MRKLLSKVPRRHLLLFLLLPLFLVFKRVIDDSIFDSVFSFLRSYANVELVQYLLLPLLFIIAFIYFGSELRNGYVPTFSSYLVCFAVLIVYLVGYRFSGEWEYFPFLKFIPHLYTADLFVPPVLIALLIFVKRNKQNKTALTPSLFFEGDVFSGKDLLNREGIGQKIADAINGTWSTKPFAIGIIGDWGYGKSVFLEFIANRLRQSNNIVIDFKPWKYRKSTDLIAAFLGQIKDELSKYDATISRDIGDYAEKLSDVSDNKFSKLAISLGLSFVKNPETDLAEKIKQLGRKIVVIIDDVDRLKPDEILEVLKIIRSSFEFSNTFFLVAYDSYYLDQGVEQNIQIKHRKRYAEKIFQLEFILPGYKKAVLISELKSKMGTNKMMDEQQHLLIEQAINELSSVTVTKNPFTGSGVNWLELFLENLRDVIRLCNELKLSFSSVPPEEFNLKEFILLSIVKTKYPAVYRQMKDKILIKPKFGINASDFTTHHMAVDDDILMEKQLEKFGLSHKWEVENIAKLLKELFPAERPLDRSIGNPDTFDLYFNYSLFSRISFKEFISAKAGGINDFKVFVAEQCAQNKGDNLTQIFVETNEYKDRADFELMIEAELELARKVNSLATQDLYLKINKVMDITSKFYGSNENDPPSQVNAVASYKDFLKRILVEEALFPFEQETTMLHGFLSVFIKDTAYLPLLLGLFTKEELQGMLLKLFERRLKDPRTKVNNDLYGMFYKNQDFIDPSSNFLTLSPDAGRMLCEFIESSPANEDDFIKILPRPAFLPNNDHGIYTLEPFLRDYMEWTKFKQFLERKSSSNKAAKLLYDNINSFEQSGFKRFTANALEMRKLGFAYA